MQGQPHPRAPRRAVPSPKWGGLVWLAIPSAHYNARHRTGSAGQDGKRKKKEAVMAATRRGGWFGLLYLPRIIMHGTEREARHRTGSTRGHQGEAMSRQCKLALPIWGREPREARGRGRRGRLCLDLESFWAFCLQIASCFVNLQAKCLFPVFLFFITQATAYGYCVGTGVHGT